MCMSNKYDFKWIIVLGYRKNSFHITSYQPLACNIKSNVIPISLPYCMSEQGALYKNTFLGWHFTWLDSNLLC